MPTPDCKVSVFPPGTVIPLSTSSMLAELDRAEPGCRTTAVIPLWVRQAETVSSSTGIVRVTVREGVGCSEPPPELPPEPLPELPPELLPPLSGLLAAGGVAGVPGASGAGAGHTLSIEIASS